MKYWHTEFTALNKYLRCKCGRGLSHPLILTDNCIVCRCGKIYGARIVE